MRCAARLLMKAGIGTSSSTLLKRGTAVGVAGAAMVTVPMLSEDAVARGSGCSRAVEVRAGRRS